MIYKVKKISFLLIAGGSLILFSTEVLGKKVLLHTETPLGLYEERNVPFVRALRQRHLLQEFPVKDQGPLGTCTSFAVSGCYKQKNPYWEISEAEFTILAETLTDDCKPGLNLGNALKFAQKMGFLTEDRLPYSRFVNYVADINRIKRTYGWEEDLKEREDPDICVRQDDKISSYNETMREIGVSCRINGTKENDISDLRLGALYPLHHASRDALKKASLPQTGRRRFIKEEGGIGTPADADIERVKQALASGYSIAAAANVFDNCWMPPNEPDCQIRLPRKTDAFQGSHAFILTGYDDQKGCFRLKNSWGAEWGNNGYAWLPYEYVRLYASELVAVGQ